MTKEIYISSTPHETRLAVVEDDQLAEIYYERENEYTLAGSVYKGKVTRVLPGMQSAFVDIGLERDAFLYVTDFAEEQEDGEDYVPLTQGHSQGNGHTPALAGAHAPSDPSSNASSKGRSGNPPRRESTSNNSAPNNSAPGNSGAADATPGSDDSGPGARRWRGRRGRRRGRGNLTSQENQSPASSASQDEDVLPASIDLDRADPDGPFELATVESEPHSEPPAEFKNNRPQKDHRPSPSHAAPQEVTMLPGESLSKYRRGEAAAPAIPSAVSAAESHPAPVAPTFQPSTMVVAPLTWDGSGLLPGESLSRYKNKPASAAAAPSTETHATPHAFSSPAAEIGASQQEPAVTAHDLPASGPASRPADATRADESNFAAATDHNDAHAGLAATENSAEAAEFEPAEASASYRFDPSTTSAYRQSSIAEPEPQSPVQATDSAAILTQEEHYPVTASPKPEAVHDVADEPFEKVAAPASEPFFGESVSLAQGNAHPRHESTPTPTETFNDEEWSEEAATSDGAEQDESNPAKTLHAFDPGQGVLEEEMIDEEETEGYLAHALLDDAEFDDLVEETLDVQMDSGLLSELVRDQHIDQRTRFVEEPGTEEEFDEETGGYTEESGEIELEEIADTEEDPDEAEGEADAAGNGGVGAPGRAPRNQPRRGTRGRQRPGQGRGQSGQRMRRATAQTSNLPAITELLKPNQEILVQIAKEPIARKGARITSHIALPGRFLVFMPTVNHVGVSRKISSDEERQRLKQILLSEKGAAGGGFIVRTAAASASEEDLRADIRFLLTLWAEMRQRAENSKPPALIYHDLSLVERVLRDQVTDNFSAIWVDSESDYERVLRFLNRFEPALVRRVKLYTKETPLFEQFGIQEEINKALRSKVWLKSGGSIVINQTEALVAIDINTGKYVGKTARLEDTILKTNLDAIPEIVRQIRLRDLGGIIVIDFIDMDERKNRNKVMQALEDALKSDRAPSKVLQFNDFGLVAITRKRVKQSLERTLSVPCSVCTGTGMVKGPLTVCNEIYIELRKMHRQLERGDVLLRVNPEVVKQLKASNGRWLSEMEEMSGKTVIVKSDASLHPEQFDIH